MYSKAQDTHLGTKCGKRGGSLETFRVEEACTHPLYDEAKGRRILVISIYTNVMDERCRRMKFSFHWKPSVRMVNSPYLPNREVRHENALYMKYSEGCV